MQVKLDKKETTTKKTIERKEFSGTKRREHELYWFSFKAGNDTLGMEIIFPSRVEYTEPSGIYIRVTASW
jgi:hypothetical protein